MFNPQLSRLYIIAECAQGYAASTLDESIILATWLVKSAKAAGADAVKFQLVIADELACPDYKYYQLFKSLELGHSGWEHVAKVANDIGIDLVFDIFGPESLLISSALGASAIKIHPTDFTNERLLHAISSAPRVNHVLAGCGGSKQEEIIATLQHLSNVDTITLLHGFQGYPTPRGDNCIRRLLHFQSYIRESKSIIHLGFADHSDPSSQDATHLASLALGFGVTVIEKHLTLACCLELEDHESALSPDTFRNFVTILRACEEASGSLPSTNKPFLLPDSELAYRKMVTRHVVSARDLVAGSLITSSDICLKRSSNNNSLTSLSSVIGRKINKTIKCNTGIAQDMLTS